MLKFKAVMKKFADQGEKTGWTYIEVSAEQAGNLIPNNKRSFRVKGFVDKVPFKQTSLLPMGEGNFIMTVKANLRKALYKKQGDTILVQMEVDHEEIKAPPELTEAFSDEPDLQAKFQNFTKGIQNYYFNWINSAKTDATRINRIAAIIRSLELNQDFGAMIRSLKAVRRDRL